jgi:outer membrane protein assembly factor BamB
LWNPPPNDTSPWAWTTSTSLIVPQTSALTAYGALNGAEQWTVRLPAPVCAIADAPNDDGVAAVLIGHGTEVNEEACSAVAAVDIRSGRLLWTRSLRGLSSYGMTDVQIGPRAVAVTNPCDRAVTFAIGDGARLATLPQRESSLGCVHSFASDGRVVVDGLRAGGDRFVGFDAVSGRPLWSVPVHASVRDRGALATADRVISSAPLVIDASVNSHRSLFRVDPRRGAVVRFGREAADSAVPVFTQAVGERVVVQYGRSPELFAYDPASGEEVSRTVLGAGESAFGARDGAVISAGAAGSALRDVGMAVRSTDPATGAQQVLGTSTLDGTAAAFGRGTGFDVALAGSTMILRTSDRLVAYDLPARGPAVRALAAPPRQAKGELAPDKAVSLCTGVTARTKQALGFAEPRLAAPAGCEWLEPIPGGGSRQLDVTTLALEPGGGQSATERARRNVARLSRADSVNHMPALKPMAGIGDQAVAGTTTANGMLLSRVVARVANVVILVDVIGADSRPRSDERPVAERGARLAAADVVAEVQRRR